MGDGKVAALQMIIQIIAASSATAASILIAALALLSNFFSRISEQYFEAMILFHQTRNAYLGRLERQFSGTGVRYQTKGGSGESEGLAFVWAVDKFFDISKDEGEAKEIKERLFDVARPWLDLSLVETILKDPEFPDFSTPKGLQLIANSMVSDNRLNFVWQYVETTKTLGDLTVHSSFASKMPRKLNNLLDGIDLVKLGFLTFILTIASALLYLALLNLGLAYVSIALFATGWGFASLSLLGLRGFHKRIATAKTQVSRPIEIKL